MLEDVGRQRKGICSLASFQGSLWHHPTWDAVAGRPVLCNPNASPRPFTHLLPGGLAWLSGAWRSDCIDHVGPLGLMTGRRVGGVEALLLFMTLPAKFRFAT